MRRVSPQEEVKSISREHTFEEDVSDIGLLESTLVALTEDVCRRLRAARLEARTVTVKIRYSDFVTHTCSHTLPRPLDVDEVFFEEVLALFRQGRRRRYRLRLVGVGLSNLVPRAWQDDLFDQELPLLRELDLKLDAIREKYGKDAVRRGAVRARRPGRTARGRAGAAGLPGRLVGLLEDADLGEGGVFPLLAGVDRHDHQLDPLDRFAGGIDDLEVLDVGSSTSWVAPLEYSTLTSLTRGLPRKRSSSF